jgi:methane/ammonia monooxygenase subunit B
MMPRYEAVQAGDGDRLITRADRIAAAVILALTLIVAGAEEAFTKMAYPVTVPLQSNQTKVAGLDEPSARIRLEPQQVNYLVPGRTVQCRLHITNLSTKPIRLGEFTTANLRFLNSAVARSERGYPADLLAPAGLVVRPDQPILPGETKEIYVEATSTVWETDRLTALMSDPTNRIGGLFMFFAPDGQRSVVEFSSAIVPTFTEDARRGK